MRKKLTFKYVKNEIEKVKGYKLLSDEYVNALTKLKIKHEKCGHEYEVTFDSFKQGRRCPVCSTKQRADKKRFSFEYIKNEIEKIEGYKLLSDIYINTHTKLKVRHEECNYEYDVSFGHFKNNKSRCPNCIGNLKPEYKYVKNYIENVKGYKLLSNEYNNNYTKLKIKHEECSRVYEVSFNSFKNSKSRCPECFGTPKLKYEYVKNYIESFKGYKLLSDEYINNHIKLKVKHEECGHEYEVLYTNFKYKEQRCPKCCKGRHISKGEQQLKDFIISKGYPFVSNDKNMIKNTKTGYPLELDLWFKELMKAIEYNGYYHSCHDQIERDRIKREQCEQLGIQLLVIEEKDWYENRNKCEEIVINFLKG